MNDGVSVPRQGWGAGWAWVAVPAGVLALVIGVLVGDPGTGMLVPLAVVGGLALMTAVVVWPFVGLLILSFSAFCLLLVYVEAVHRNVNPIDLVLWPLLFAWVIAWCCGETRAREACEIGPAHEAVRRATHRLTQAAVLYFGLAAFSLVPMALHLGIHSALISALSLSRAVQGALLFPLAMLWLRDETRVQATLRAIFLAGLCLGLVNGIAVFVFGVSRAGSAWTVNDPFEPISGPNEAATGLLMLWALLRARHAVRPSWIHLPFMGLVMLMLALTRSRSGLLAFAVFLLLSIRHVRWRRVASGALLFLVVALIVPPDYWQRLVRSLTFQQGSFEVFSFLIRVHGYGVAWQVFLAHPLLGVGYLGYRFVSVQYNDLHLVLVTAENFFLETLTGLGVVGFAVVVVVLRRLYALGAVVRRVAPAGTLAHELARRTGPLLTALLVANLTGDGLVGLVGIGQVALWSALLLRAGHLAVTGSPETGGNAGWTPVHDGPGRVVEGVA